MSRISDPQATTTAQQSSHENRSEDTREVWVTRAIAAAMANLRSAAPSSEPDAANERRSEWDFKSV